MLGFFAIFAVIIILGGLFQDMGVLLIGFGWIGANIILYIIIVVVVVAGALFLGYYLTQMRTREP
ncbi:MAG: hypothetical protein ACFE8L_05090, partial [Candidatus Hodarchaeota archaeon]